MLAHEATASWLCSSLAQLHLAAGSSTTPDSFLLPVVLALVGAGCVAGLTWAGVFTRRSLHRRAEARARALAAADAMTSAFLTLDRARAEVGARVEALPEVEDVTVAEIRAMVAATTERVGAVTARYPALREKYGARRAARLDTCDAAVAEHTMSTLTATLRALVEEVGRAQADLDALDALRAVLPERIENTRAIVAELGRLLPERSRQGFFVDAYAAVVPRIEQGCVEAESLVGQVRVGDAGVAADTASALARELQARVEGLPEWQERLRIDLDSLRAKQKHCRLLLMGARGVTDQLAATRPASRTDDVVTLLAETAGRLAELPAVLEQLDRASSMQVQDFDAAQELADRARALVSEIETGCSAPVARRDQLDGLVPT